jgi:hypothetical protein
MVCEDSLARHTHQNYGTSYSNNQIGTTRSYRKWDMFNDFKVASPQGASPFSYMRLKNVIEAQLKKRAKQSRGSGDCFPAERGISFLPMTNPRPSYVRVTTQGLLHCIY